MAKTGATPIERPPAGSEPAAALPTGPNARPGDDALVAMFNRVRDELVSTLLYLLGNPDDAQDAGDAVSGKVIGGGDNHHGAPVTG